MDKMTAIALICIVSLFSMAGCAGKEAQKPLNKILIKGDVLYAGDADAPASERERVSNDESYTIKILDSSGSEISATTATNGRYQLELPGVKTGLFKLLVYEDDELISSDGEEVILDYGLNIYDMIVIR